MALAVLVTLLVVVLMAVVAVVVVAAVVVAAAVVAVVRPHVTRRPACGMHVPPRCVATRVSPPLPISHHH